MDSLFIPTGPDSFDPTPLTGGPWRPDAQHGGPPAALLARTIETSVRPDERVARVSIELLRPVPLANLTTSVERTQVSRRVAHVGAALAAGTSVVATARALLLTTSALPEPGWRPTETPQRPAEGRVITPPPFASGDNTAFHRDAVEHRVVEGGFGRPGPAVEWIRLRQPVVEGEQPSPLVRVVAASDIASGVSAIYDVASGVGLINADLTIAVHRPLIGEWVGVDAVTRVGPDGVGLCVTRLFDTEGTIGNATQSLLGYSF